jgi:adenosylcobinamide kinase/adenosylcobinamide-phosphate guanylyltransferase
MPWDGVVVDKKLVLILGGAPSGKSAYVERLAGELAGDGGVLNVATAQALDDEMAARIARHRAARPAAWRTLEEPRDVGPAIEATCAGAAVVVVDCVTLWISNLLLASGAAGEGLGPAEADRVDASARAAVDRLLAAHRSGTACTLLVSNEVGMGLVPPYPLGRLYRDVLGRVNTQIAAAADEVLLMVAGLPLRLKPGGGGPFSPLPA